MSDAFNRNLPGDLATLLGDARIVIPGESEVLEMVAAWALAPSDTPSAPVARPSARRTSRDGVDASPQ